MTGGDLAVSTAAALVGSKGMQAVIDDSTAIYVRKVMASEASAYTARFRFDPNAIPMAADERYTMLYGYASAGAIVLSVECAYVGGQYKLKALARKDDAAWTSTSDYTISDGPHTIEIAWAASSASGANNGSLKLSIDGVVKYTTISLDNDTYKVKQARSPEDRLMGAVAGIDASTRGTVYFDDFASWKTTASASFTYDGDNNRVKGVENGVLTVYLGDYYEWAASGSITLMPTQNRRIINHSPS